MKFYELFSCIGSSKLDKKDIKYEILTTIIKNIPSLEIQDDTCELSKNIERITSELLIYYEEEDIESALNDFIYFHTCDETTDTDTETETESESETESDTKTDTLSDTDSVRQLIIKQDPLLVMLSASHLLFTLLICVKLYSF